MLRPSECWTRDLYLKSRASKSSADLSTYLSEYRYFQQIQTSFLSAVCVCEWRAWSRTITGKQMTCSKEIICVWQTADCFIGVKFNGPEVIALSVCPSGWALVQCTPSGLCTHRRLLNISCCLVSVLLRVLLLGWSQTWEVPPDHFYFKQITKGDFYSWVFGVQPCWVPGEAAGGEGWSVNYQFEQQQLESIHPGWNDKTLL